MNLTKRRPIPTTVGVFDSGVGGLSVMRALIGLLPHQPISYVADNVHCPYGPRPASEIIAFAQGITRYLHYQGSNVIVVACNTASAAALEPLRQTFPHLSFVGMVPAIKPAAALTRSGVVGVLATEGTLRGRLYEDAMEQWTHGVRVISRTCPGLVEHIERGESNPQDTQRILSQCLAPLLAEGIDVLVLGCTHYPFLIPTLRHLLPEGTAIVEPSAAIARQTYRVLAEKDLLVPAKLAGMRRYAATGDPSSLQRAVKQLLGEQRTVERLTWQHGELHRSQLTTI